MKIELELENLDDYEWDVWGGEEGQEGEHFGTFGRFEEAVEYKAEMEKTNPRLRLHIKRAVSERDD